MPTHFKDFTYHIVQSSLYRQLKYESVTEIWAYDAENDSEYFGMEIMSVISHSFFDRNTNMNFPKLFDFTFWQFK